MTQRKMIEEIHRGLYGDEKNGVEGLIARQTKDEEIREDQEKRISSLEGWRKRVMWIVGCMMTLGSTVTLNWDKIKSFFITK